MRNFVENFLAHLTVKTACIDILCEESYPLLNESHCASENKGRAVQRVSWLRRKSYELTKCVVLCSFFLGR